MSSFGILNMSMMRIIHLHRMYNKLSNNSSYHGLASISCNNCTIVLTRPHHSCTIKILTLAHCIEYITMFIEIYYEISVIVIV